MTSLPSSRSRQPSTYFLQVLTSVAVLLKFSTLFTLGFILSATAAVAEEDSAMAEKRLYDSVKYLASDELEGRGIGTDGLNKAADYVATQFQKLGLKTNIFDGKPFQQFTMTTHAELGPLEKNRLSFIGPPKKGEKQPQTIHLEIEKDFNTLAIGGSGEFDLPLVFVGYGITAKNEKYDDYEKIDVKGKAVLMLRKEPQQRNPHSVFNGARPSNHAFFTRKIANAFEHGAAAVILVNDRVALEQKSQNGKKTWQESVEKLTKLHQEFSQKKNPSADETKKYQQQVNQFAEQIQSLGKKLPDDYDQVLAFRGAGNSGSHRKMPVFFTSRSSVTPLIESSYDGRDLASIEAAIDQDLTPQSHILWNWKAVGQASVLHKKVDVKNVIAVLEGKGALANETVIVGAHYDHLGRGGAGSLAPWTKDIHNGADDNASGTAVLLEVASRLASREQAASRRIVFIAFTGEERGLLGSAYYVRSPRFPLERTVAMINMDMVGRLKDDKLIIFGTGTAVEFDKLVDDLNKKYSFQIIKKSGGFGPSDHSSFYAKKIPVMHIFTGTHSDYHRPSDDVDKINVPGMRRVSEMVAAIVASIASQEKKPQFKETKRPKFAGGGGDRPYFGSIPDFSLEVEGYALGGVAKGGPADKAGIRGGDVIIKFGESRIGGLEDIDSALRKFKAGDKVPVVVKRDGKPLTLTVTLEPSR